MLTRDSSKRYENNIKQLNSQANIKTKCATKHFTEDSINLDNINKTLLKSFISIEMLGHFTLYNPGFVIRKIY